MKIVIDARWIGAAPSGISVYTKQLIRRLPRLKREWTWILVFDKPDIMKETLEECCLCGLPNVKVEVVPYGVFSLLGQLKMPKLLRHLKCDLYHTTNFMMPYAAFRRGGTDAADCGVCVSTVHDVIPLIVKSHAPKSRKSRMLPLFRFCLSQTASRSAALITVSQTSRRDIIGALSLSPAQAANIRTIYNGVDEVFSPRNCTENKSAETSKIKTILYVGRLDPYKNVETLVRAFAAVRRKLHGQSLQLLCIGPEDPRYPEARSVARDLGLCREVSFLSGVSQADLAAAYRESAVLVNPSSYEGFGMPMIEAMRSGVPVICCDGGAQREIGAHAALVTPPGDMQALADAIETVLLDPKLHDRMVADGLRRANDFSWEKTAAETLAVYRDALKHVGRL